MNDDFEDRISAALNAHVDNELGERRTPPVFDAPVGPALQPSARSRMRRAPWLLPLVAAASVVAVVAGSVGATQLIADNGPASRPSPLVSGRVSPTPSPSGSPTGAPTSAVPESSAASTTSGAPKTSHPHSNPPPAGTTVMLDGSRIALPAGWHASDGPTSNGTPYRHRYCLNSPAVPCAIVLGRVDASAAANGLAVDVDAQGFGMGDPPQYLCTMHPLTVSSVSEQYGDRTLGGRGADWRHWDRSCAATGRSWHIEQWVVDTDPAWTMFTDAATSSTSAAMVYVAQHSVLAPQARPLRLSDRGIVRSAHRTAGGMLIQLDRIALIAGATRGGPTNVNPATYPYTVPIALWRSSKLKVGDEAHLVTDGYEITRLDGRRA